MLPYGMLELERILNTLYKGLPVKIERMLESANTTISVDPSSYQKQLYNMLDEFSTADANAEIKNITVRQDNQTIMLDIMIEVYREPQLVECNIQN